MVAAAVVAVAENHKPAAVQMVELATIMVAQEQHGQMVLHMLAAEEEDRKLVPHMLLVEPAEAAEAVTETAMMQYLDPQIQVAVEEEDLVQQPQEVLE